MGKTSASICACSVQSGLPTAHSTKTDMALEKNIPKMTTHIQDLTFKNILNDLFAHQ
jgi:hypothetical protein